jgi:hypothetical protein
MPKRPTILRLVDLERRAENRYRQKLESGDTAAALRAVRRFMAISARIDRTALIETEPYA